VLTKTAIARIRQLAAHEVGHTLGLGHQYYNSAKGRISVMDYPHPLEKLNADGTIDLSEAYAAGIGDWDKVAIAYGYQDFPKGTDEAGALRKILDDAWKQDLIYLTNQDTDATPKSDQWNNGAGIDMAAELNRLMKIRRAALNRFDETVIRKDAPMATMEEALVPLYMYHRYAVEAAASAVGGPGLHLRVPRRRSRCRPSGCRRASRRPRSRRWRHAEAVGAGAAEERAAEDPAAPVGLGHAPRTVRALHRRRVRPDQPGAARGRDDRVRCSPTAPRAWSRSTRSIRRCRASRRHQGAARRYVHGAGGRRHTSRRIRAPRRACSPKRS
jgi:hypothetical protein